MSNYLLSNAFLIPFLKVLIILMATVIFNIYFRSLVKVPHKFDTRKSRSYIFVLRNLITVVLVIIALHITFITLGINIAPLLASAGVIGLVVGIGARSLFEDLIAGFFLLSQSQIGVGDYIKLSQNIEGTVVNIGFRTLELSGVDGSRIFVPNGQVNIVTNSSNGKAISTIEVPVKNGQNIDKVIKAFEDVLKAMKKDDELGLDRKSKV